MSRIQLQGVDVFDAEGRKDSVFGRQVNILPDVGKAYRDKRRVPLCDARVNNIDTFDGGNDWVCTLPKGHPDYCPHMAGDAGPVSRVLGMWYDMTTIAKYRISVDTPSDPGIRASSTDIQGVTFSGGFALPDGTRIGRDSERTCSVSNQAGFYRCTLGKGHVDYCPHMGAAGRVTGIWYGNKELKRYGLLPAGVKFPGKPGSFDGSS